MRSTCSSTSPIRIADSFFLLAALLCIGLCAGASAAQYLDFTYQVVGTKVEIIGYTGAGGAVTIPNTIAGRQVAGIGLGAFSGHNELTSITLPANATNIAKAAFQHCLFLTNVTLPDKLLAIGDYSFFDCQRLPSISLGKAVRSIGENAFFGCANLASVYVDPQNTNLASIGGVPFATDRGDRRLIFYPPALTGPYAIPPGTTEILSRAFFGNHSLTEVTIPPTVTLIWPGAFGNCDGLRSLSIPGSVQVIGSEAFYHCGQLVNLAISNGVVSIAESAFAYCTNLESITIPQSVERVGVRAFSNCHQLTNVVIRNGVLRCEYGAFEECLSLKEVSLPNSLTVLDSLFFRCWKLPHLDVPNSVTGYGIGGPCPDAEGLGSGTVSGSGARLMGFPGCTSLTNVVVPYNVREVGDGAFWGTSLTSIVIPKGVTNIGYGAFKECHGLSSIYFEGNAPSVEPYAFFETDNLRVYYHPDTKGWGATFGEGYLTVPWEVASYGGFEHTNDGSHVTVTRYTGGGGTVEIPAWIDGLPVTSIADNAFADHHDITQVTLPVGLLRIGASSFTGCTNLFLISIPDTVTNIGAYAFDRCSSLREVALPAGLTSIADWTFGHCSNLVGVTIPDNIRRIGFSAFSDCRQLHDVRLSAGLTDLGDSAFAYCSNLHGISLPVTLTNLGGGAFMWCHSLTNIVIPPKVTTVRYSTLLECTSLTGITLPEGIVDIERASFAGCSALTNIVIPGTLLHFGDLVFGGCERLTLICCRGNAPLMGLNRFGCRDSTLVAHRADATGWGPTLGGLATVLSDCNLSFEEWALASGLLVHYPEASREHDDPDHDGADNLAEMRAGTDPTDSSSALQFDSLPRPADLEAADREPIADDQHALYFSTVPGRTYLVEAAEVLNGPWQLVSTVTATTTQKRLVFSRPETQRFYQVQVQP